MAVPKKKPSHTQSATKEMAWRRGAQAKLKNRTNISRCNHCNEPKRSHMACPSCGQYGAKKATKNVEAKKEAPKPKKAPAAKPAKKTDVSTKAAPAAKTDAKAEAKKEEK